MNLESGTAPESEARFGHEDVLEKEESWVERGKKLGKAFLLATAVVLSIGAIEKGEAREEFKGSASKVEKNNSPKQKALDFIRMLYIGTNESAPDPVRKYAGVINSKVLIHQFALERARQFPEGRIVGMATREDLRGALNDLNEALEDFADQEFGNGDGKADDEEVLRLKQVSETNAGLRALRDMILLFLSGEQR